MLPVAERVPPSSSAPCGRILRIYRLCARFLKQTKDAGTFFRIGLPKALLISWEWKLGDNPHARETRPPCCVKPVADYGNRVTGSNAEAAHRFNVLPLHRGVELRIDFLVCEVTCRANESRNQHDGYQGSNDHCVWPPRARTAANPDSGK